MVSEKKNSKNLTLQKKVKNIINKSKRLGLVKPHEEAFKKFPVEQEEHKGKKSAFER